MLHISGNICIMLLSVFKNTKKGVKAMAYCQSCGTKRIEGNQFCMECGEAFKDVNAAENLEEVEEVKKEKETNLAKAEKKEEVTQAKKRQEQVKKEKKKRNKWIPVLIVLALIIFGVHKYFEHHYAFETKLIKINSALSDKDEEALFKLISVEEDVPLNKAGYLKGLNDSWVSDVQAEFEAYSMSQQDNPSLLSKELGELGTPQFLVKPKNVLLGLYVNYEIHAKPEEIGFETIIENTELDIQGEKYTLEKTNEAKEILVYPYKLTVKAKGKNSFGEFSDETELDQSELQDNFLSIDFNGEMYDLTYDNYDVDYGEASLYVNGEDTQIKLKELDEIGPIPKDKNIEVFAALNDQVSKVIRLPNEIQTAYFEFDSDIKMDISKVDDPAAGALVLSFREAYESAMNHLEYSYIESYLEADSEAAKGLKEFINEHPTNFYRYDFQLNEILEVKKGKDNLVHVKTREVFDFYDGSKDHHYDRKKTYDLVEVDGNYLIHKINYDKTDKK